MPTGIDASTESRCAALGWTLEHLGSTIGTVIHGPHLASAATMEEEAIGALYAVLLERKVICFHGCQLTEEQHITFAERFGTLEVTARAGWPEPHLCNASSEESLPTVIQKIP